MLTIGRVRTDEDAETVRVLVGEFLEWLAERYPDHAELIAEYFKQQNLEEQLRNLLTIFCPPTADCLLARVDGVPAGIVMVKPSSGDLCEMNRMFVRPAARGHGVGRALVAELLDTARGLGYRRMMLAAGIRHDEAVALYRAMGFAEDMTMPDTGAGKLEVRMVRDL